MRKRVSMAFEAETVFVELANILPVKQFPGRIQKTQKYRQIAASIQEIGIIEPPVVARERNGGGKFLMLDGHLRIEVLKELGVEGVACLVATDDEAFTYNKRILPPYPKKGALQNATPQKSKRRARGSLISGRSRQRSQH